MHTVEGDDLLALVSCSLTALEGRNQQGSAGVAQLQLADLLRYCSVTPGSCLCEWAALTRYDFPVVADLLVGGASENGKNRTLRPGERA